MSKIMPDVRTTRRFLPQEKLSMRNVQSIGLKYITLLFNKWYRNLHMTVMITFIILGYFYSTYGKVVLNVHLSAVLSLIDHVSNFLMTLSNLFAVISLTRFEEINSMLFTLMAYISTKTKSKTVFGVISAVFTIMSLIIFGLGGYVTVTMFGWPNYKYGLFKDAEFVFLNVNLWSTCEFYYSLKCMFNDLNRELTKIYEKTLNSSQIVSIIDQVNISTASLRPIEDNIKVIYLHKTPRCLNVLRDLTRRHNQLCQYVESFNNVVGPIIFLSIVSVIVNIIWALTILIEYDIRMAILGNLKVSAAVLISNITDNFLRIVIMGGQAVLIATIGWALVLEGKNSSVICYKMLNQQSFKEHSKEAGPVKHQLKILAKQAETRCPKISAGGLFSVDLSMLGMVTSNVFAYSIIAIQFILNEH